MDTNNKKLVPVTVTVEPEEINYILRAYDTLQDALLVYLADVTLVREDRYGLMTLNNHIASLRTGLLAQVIQE